MAFNSNLDLVVLCGGLGTRLGEHTKVTPKPLLDVDGKPFLFRLLLRLKQEGCCGKIILAVRYLAEQFQKFANDYASHFGEICVIEENSPLGTGGALRNAALAVTSDHFVVCNGDSFLTQSLKPVIAWHQERENVFTMVAVRADNVEGGVGDKGGLEIAKDGKILKFSGHQSENEQWVNGGLYVLSKKKALSWPEGFYNLENTLDSLMKPDSAFAFLSQGELLDIGKPECFQIAGHKLKMMEQEERL